MKLIFILLTVSLSLPVIAQKQSVEFAGTVPGVSSGKIYLRKFYNKMFSTLESSPVINGKFKFTSSIDLPEVYGLTTDTSQSHLYLFLDKDTRKVDVELNVSSASGSKVTGSAGNLVFNEYLNGPDNIKIDTLILRHPKSIATLYILYRLYAPELTANEIEHALSLLDPSFKNTQYVKLLRDLVAIYRRVEVGQKAIDFTMSDTTGKPVKLSDQFGKYLLLDFWASWCGPCRRENPNVVRMYQKFKDKEFTIVGVSLDSKRESWVKAIRNDNLTWLHVSDLGYWNNAAAQMYGIRAIPSNVLIDPSGTIIARNLTGEDLEKKLDEVFAK